MRQIPTGDGRQHNILQQKAEKNNNCYSNKIKTSKTTTSPYL
jgi:hypothetical protein